MGADYHYVRKDGYTLLHSAAFGGVRDTIEFLLSEGLDINAVDNNGHTPFDWAFCHLRIVMESYDRFYGLRTPTVTSEDLEYLIAHGADPRIGPEDLGCIVRWGPQFLETLINRGMNIDLQNDDGLTLMHYAARENGLGLVKVLFEHGADVHKRDRYGQTPLDLARKELQELEAKTEAGDRMGDEAGILDYQEIIELLERAGNDE